MEVLSVHTFHGSNRWSHLPVAEIVVDCRRWSAPKDRKSAVERLRRYVPGLEESAFELLASKPARLLKRITIALQAATGVPAEVAQVHATKQSGIEQVVVSFEEAALLKECVHLAQRIMHVVEQSSELDAAAELRRLRDLADNVRLGPSSQAIVRAARARGIPVRRMNTGSLIQLGEGKHQRRTWTAETDATSALAESIASDKDLTKMLLRAVGVPVPRGRPVESANDAWEAAQEIGLPVAVKPRRANHARGISLDLSRQEQFAGAFEFALQDGDHTGVMVEQFAPGQAHRLLVVGDRMVAAARGESEYVIGDGKHTISQLVDEVNRDPRRGENYTDLLNVLKLDAGALIELKKQNLTPDSVPEAGEHVLVQPVGDLTTDVTEQVHPRNAAYAVLAAKAVGLDIAGIDLVADDISRPLDEQRGMILEVNAGPSLSMHIAPLHGKPQPVGEAIVELLFGPHATGRVPIVTVVGSQGQAVVDRIEALWRAAGIVTGTATDRGIRIGGAPLATDARTDAERIAALVLHPQVEAIVWHCDWRDAARQGLACGRSDALIITSEVAEDEDLVDGIVSAVRSVPAGGAVLIDRAAACFDRVQAACRGSLIQRTDRAVEQMAADVVAGLNAAAP